MEQAIENVEVDLGPWHRAKWRQQFILLPLTFRPDDYDLVADELAGAEIVFPVFRNKDFENRAGTKSRSRRAGEPDQMLGEIVWNQFRAPGF